MTQHKAKTGKTYKVKLESTIEQVLWMHNAATPGGKVGLEVCTKFIGNNSDIAVKITDKSGKTFNTIKKKMSGNKFWTEITVPEKAKNELYAEAKLSKLGLEKKSNGLHLFPPIQIKNLKWDKQEAHRGDILKMTADIEGLADGNEVELQIWEHDADGVHDFITKFPVIIKNKKVEANWEFQYVEDTDDIPTHEESEKGYQWPEYFFRIVTNGKSSDSGLLKFKDFIEIEWVYDNNEPAANRNFKLISADGTERNGSFDGDGRYNVGDISPGPFNIILEDDEEEDSDSNENDDEEKEIKIVLKDHNGNKFVNKKYEIRIGQKVISGNTDSEGLIKAKFPINILQAKLLVWLKKGEKASYSTILQLQDFEDDNNTHEIQMKLQNLGFYAGRIDGELGNMTKEAIKNFQKKNNLTVTGEVNPALTSKISNKFKNKQ